MIIYFLPEILINWIESPTETVYVVTGVTLKMTLNMMVNC